MTSLEAQLASLPADVQQVLSTCGFSAARLIALAKPLQSGVAADNVVKGTLTPPTPDDVVQLPAPGSAEHARLTALGREALARGEYALVVLAGGMATRMGGVVKALVDAVPGQSFLDLRLREVEVIRERYGKTPPLWLMTSYSTDEKIRAGLGNRRRGDEVATFLQELSLRLTPNGELFLGADQRPSEHAPGHGDLPDRSRQRPTRALRRARWQDADDEQRRHLGGTIDPLIWAFTGTRLPVRPSRRQARLRSRRHSRAVDGKPCVLEEFRIRKASIRRRCGLQHQRISFRRQGPARARHAWTFSPSRRGRRRTVIQFERLVNEVCSILPTKYLHYAHREHSRFLPVKDNEELAARVPEIQAVAKAHGWL